LMDNALINQHISPPWNTGRAIPHDRAFQTVAMRYHISAQEALPSNPEAGCRHGYRCFARHCRWHAGIHSVEQVEDAMNRNIIEQCFPIVCVGGSAGGLDAYTRLLHCMSNDIGVAVVVVNHIRHKETLLHEVLPRFTKLPVDLITEKLAIIPNHVFVIPSNHDLHIQNGEFRLKPISKPRGWPDVITVFLDSLSQHWRGKIIAVIVSGYDGDGAAALRGIKEVGGITFAQKPDTAKEKDMPQSAISSGYIDFILSPEDICSEISRIARASRE
ncbi:MAG: chemotaxis protein CheB, partial [Candidatus Methylumidiphilus sp.]